MRWAFEILGDRFSTQETGLPCNLCTWKSKKEHCKPPIELQMIQYSIWLHKHLQYDHTLDGSEIQAYHPGMAQEML